MNEKKLKPVTFVGGKRGYTENNVVRQMILLKALTVTQDPEKLKAMIGVKRVADVYRTLDKMAMRKEYHEALAQNGISFDYLVKQLKTEIDEGYKASDRINAVKVLLKSVGMEKYEESATPGGSWEDEILRLNDTKKEEVPAALDVDYEVIRPEAPAEVTLERELEKRQGKSLYE